MIPPPLPPRAPGDRIVNGVGITVMCQLAFIIGSGLGIFTSPYAIVAFASWGLWQWIVFIPLCLWHRGKGRPLTAKGIVIVGCIGFLLNAGCDLLILPGPFR
jgi:hypothetical protein